MKQFMRYGASHASEIPYVFDNLRERNGIVVQSKDQEVAKVMNAYWVNFAKSGNPNANGLPTWPAYHPKNEQILEFRADGTTAASPYHTKARLDVIEKEVNFRKK
jgi:para-nitrobenzyl esterase